MTTEDVTTPRSATSGSDRRGPGRPRSAPKAGSETSTRDEILTAAATLFSQQGYERTTTRQIAELVGIKQASLYYHFSDKSSIVLALLDGTVSPSVAFSEWLSTIEASPEARLFSLARFDLDTIIGDPWNMHVLFRIPDIAASEEASDQAELTALQSRYTGLARECRDRFAPADGGVADSDLTLVFGLVEGIVNQRYWGDVSARAVYAETVPRGCLRMLLVPEAAIARASSDAADIIARYRGRTAPV